MCQTVIDTRDIVVDKTEKKFLEGLGKWNIKLLGYYSGSRTIFAT